MISTDNQRIHQLPPHIVDQIKAGEVIERSSNLIKELVENAIDANATKISIEIKDNGLDTLIISDNGIGMAYEDMAQAFNRHATSKIEQFEDLYRLHSYGFRGEALASIASISKVTCHSKQANFPRSTYKIEGGMEVSLTREERCDESSGTSFIIRDLFYNTPARFKFIQSKNSEKNAIKKILNAFLLTWPQIEFQIKWDDSDKLIYPRCQDDLMLRIYKMFHSKKDRPLYADITREYDDMHFKAYLCHQTQSSPSQRHQYLFVNKRFIQDIKLHKIILNSTKGLWPYQDSGNYFCFINLPSDQVDVNVHPSKIAVKFHRPSQLYSLVSQGLKSLAFAETNERAQENYTSFQKQEFTPPRTGEAQEINYHQTDFQTLHTNTENSHATASSSGVILHQRFYLSSEMEQACLIDLNRSLIEEFFKLFNQHFTSHNALPLLIGHPLRFDEEKMAPLIELLTSIGFEIDTLSPLLHIVKAIPQSLDMELTPKLIQFFCQLISEKNLTFNNSTDLHKTIIPHIEDLAIKWTPTLAKRLVENQSIVIRATLDKKTCEQLFL